MKSKFAIMLLAILAVSSFAFYSGASASPLVSSTTISTTPPIMPPISIQRNSVRMFGSITEWETTPTSTPVMGSITAMSGIVIGPRATTQRFAATALWTTNVTRPIAAVRTRENFTYSFYTARLIQGNTSALDSNGNAFFLNGTWNVWSVTEAFTIRTNSTTGRILSVHCNVNAVPLATDAYGTLTVPAGWNTFTLAINGVAPLTGKVVAEVTVSAVLNPFMVSPASSTATVTRSDLAAIVSAYGSMPGYGNYNINMDYTLHYKIDICDLATAAANLA